MVLFSQSGASGSAGPEASAASPRVFRFGAADLDKEQSAREMLRGFFEDLFRTYHVA